MATARSRKQERVPDFCSKIKGNCGFRGRGGYPSCLMLAGEVCPRTLAPAPTTHPPAPPAAKSWSSRGCGRLPVAGGWVPSGCLRTLARLWGPGLRWLRLVGGRASRRLPAGDLCFFFLDWRACGAPDSFFFLLFPWNYAIMIIISRDFSYAFSFWGFFAWLFWLSLSFSGCCGCYERFASSYISLLSDLGGMRRWDWSLGPGLLFWVPLFAGLLGGLWALWLWALGLCPPVRSLHRIGGSRRSGLAGGPALFPGLPGWSLSFSALLWGWLRFLGVRGLCSWLWAAASSLAPWLCGSPCLGWSLLGGLGSGLVAGASPSPPGAAFSLLVLLYCSAFLPGIYWLFLETML